MTDVNDAGFAHELPNGYPIRGDQGRLSGNRTMSRSIELGAGILVEGENVTVKGAERTNPQVMVDVKRWEEVGPVAGEVGCHHQGEVHELDFVWRHRRCPGCSPGEQ